MSAGLKCSVAIALMLAILAGCQGIMTRSLGQHIDDPTITASVRSRLVVDEATDLTRVHVDSNAGIVTLTGVVDSDREKTRADELARQVEGVSSVVNNLQIQTVGRVEAGVPQ